MKRILAGAAVLALGVLSVFADFGERNFGFDLFHGLTIGACAAIGAFLLITGWYAHRGGKGARQSDPSA